MSDDWQNKSANKSGEYNVIRDCSRAVLEVIDTSINGLRFLDLGCGSGQLVINVASRGIEAEGSDFFDEMAQFFNRCYDMLRPGGYLVVGSRNRLFNIFSLNEFTTLEVSLGIMNVLLSKAVAL